MWFVKHFFCVIFFFTAGCTSVFTSHPQGVQEHLGHIFVLNIPDIMGQYMRLQLLSKLPRSNTYHYTLEIQLESRDSSLVVSSEGLSVRGRIATKITYVLRLRSTQEILLEGSLASHSSYSTIEQDFFSVTSVKKFTEESNIQRIVDSLILLLAAYFKKQT